MKNFLSRTDCFIPSGENLSPGRLARTVNFPAQGFIVKIGDVSRYSRKVERGEQRPDNLY